MEVQTGPHEFPLDLKVQERKAMQPLGVNKTKFLQFNYQLRKAVMDHVSDSFLETNVPLLVLIEAAKNGNEKEVKEYAQVFREHANKLIEVSILAVSLTIGNFIQCVDF